MRNRRYIMDDSEFEFCGPNRDRLHRYFTSISVENMWWIDGLSGWVHMDDLSTYSKYSFSSRMRCKTFKAFKSHIRRHQEIGFNKATLSSRFYIKDPLCALDITYQKKGS